MAKRQRVIAPPPQLGDRNDAWFNQVTNALNTFPNLSIISTANGPNSVITSDPYNLAFDVGSSATHLWFKSSGSTTTGWEAFTIGSVTKDIVIQIFGGADDVTTGDGKAYFTIGNVLNGKSLIECHARCITAGVTNPSLIQVARYRVGWVDMLSTRIMIDSTELGSDTAATPYVINAANDDVAEYDLIRIDIDQVSTTPPKGLTIRLTFI